MRHIGFMVLSFAMAIMATSCTEDDDILSTVEYRKAKSWDKSVLDKSSTTNDTLKAAADPFGKNYEAYPADAAIEGTCDGDVPGSVSEAAENGDV